MKCIADYIYEIFVFNRKAISAQIDDGTYRTFYIDVNPSLIFESLKSGESIGTYQNRLYSDVIKWVCIDFDSKMNNINEFYKIYVSKVIEYLKKHKINFLLEFSGRRGFHIWLTFQSILTKNIGYEIIDKILKDNNLQDECNDYSIDRFPQTRYGKNKVGKTVKLPLSKHKKSGFYSYLLHSDIDEVHLYRNINNVLDSQIDILKLYKPNLLKSTLNSLKIDIDKFSDLPLFYKKVSFEIQKKDYTIEDIESVLKTLKPFMGIFDRLRSGQITVQDRMILIGALSKIKGLEGLIYDFFSLYPDYDSEKSKVNINRIKERYFPLTLRYLYELYNYEYNIDYDSNLTISHYLLDKLGVNKVEVNSHELRNLDYIRSSISKEKNYISYNDEIIDFFINNDLNKLKAYDIEFMINIFKNIENGDYTFNQQYQVFLRNEGDKIRKLISLSARDRVLTTALILKLQILLCFNYDSYSYNVSINDSYDVFYSWLSSWNRYKNEISKYLRINIFKNYRLIKVDLKAYYDSLILHSTIEEMEHFIDKKLSRYEDKKVATNILRFLIKYNEKLMKTENGSIIGVPQGPAYARILAEFSLSVIMKKFFNKYIQYKNVKYYRYVDDIYFIYNDNINEKSFLIDLELHLYNYALVLNEKKTIIYGKISDLKLDEKLKIDGFGSVKYLIRKFDNLNYFDEKQHMKWRNEFSNYISREKDFNINDANFIINNYIDDNLIKEYMHKFSKDIISSSNGRGSIFTKVYRLILNNDYWLRYFVKNRLFELIPEKSLNLEVFSNELLIIYDLEHLTNSTIDSLNYIIDWLCKEKNMTGYSIRNFDIINTMRKVGKTNG